MFLEKRRRWLSDLLKNNKIKKADGDDVELVWMEQHKHRLRSFIHKLSFRPHIREDNAVNVCREELTAANQN